MTTAVTVDAHAGWPVSVTLVLVDQNGNSKETSEVVEALTEKTYYIHDGMHLGSIREMKRDQ